MADNRFVDALADKVNQSLLEENKRLQTEIDNLRRKNRKLQHRLSENLSSQSGSQPQSSDTLPIGVKKMYMNTQYYKNMKW